jgi:ribosomal protein S18 acetylase RimI-like enzyme
LSLAAPPRFVEAELDAALLEQVSPYYGELERGFHRTHLPSIGRPSRSVGFSSIEKMAFAITEHDEVVGKLVVTLKRAWTLKIAPLFVSGHARGRGLARAAVAQVTARAKEMGIRQVFTTVPRANERARRVFQGAGFERGASLADHYAPGIAEDVLVAWPSAEQASWLARPQQLGGAGADVQEHVERAFFPTDSAWTEWLGSSSSALGDFEDKPHNVVTDDSGAALVIYKRGGTAKVVPAGVITDRLVAMWEDAARRRQRRKVSVFIPQQEVVPPALRKYTAEALAPTYSLYQPIAIFSRFL